MKENCLKILKENGYDVDPESGIIVDTTINNPVAYITYNKEKNSFGVMVPPIVLEGDQNINYYSEVMAAKFELVEKLNYHCRKDN